MGEWLRSFKYVHHKHVQDAKKPGRSVHWKYRIARKWDRLWCNFWGAKREKD